MVQNDPILGFVFLYKMVNMFDEQNNVLMKNRSKKTFYIKKCELIPGPRKFFCNFFCSFSVKIFSIEKLIFYLTCMRKKMGIFTQKTIIVLQTKMMTDFSAPLDFFFIKKSGIFYQTYLTFFIGLQSQAYLSL